MPDSPIGGVIALIPTDPALRAKINETLPSDSRWKPSIEHSLTTCDDCQRECWIGPKQLEIYRSVFVKHRKICAVCIALAANHLGLDAGV